MVQDVSNERIRALHLYKSISSTQHSMLSSVETVMKIMLSQLDKISSCKQSHKSNLVGQLLQASKRCRYREGTLLISVVRREGFMLSYTTRPGFGE